MFSGIFNKKRYPNDEKMKKIMKESMDKYIRGLDERYKIPPTYTLGIPFIINKDTSYNTLLNCEDFKIKIDEENVNITDSLINIIPFVLFGVGIYQLCRGLFIKH